MWLKLRVGAQGFFIKMKKNKEISFSNIREVKSKDILKAGITLGVGYAMLPFIRFDKTNKPFEGDFHIMPDGSLMKGKKH